MKFARRFLYVLVMLGAAGAYGVFGFFQVEPDEEAVVLRLGAYDRTLAKGPHWHALGHRHGAQLDDHLPAADRPAAPVRRYGTPADEGVSGR